jgi:hypothetical protein
MDRVMLAQEQDLAPLLQQFNKWTFPKGDLFQWVAVLDKCDAILESKCRQYALEKIQVKPFEEGDRVLLVAILAFTAFLLDHCANRSLYSSANVRNQALFPMLMTEHHRTTQHDGYRCVRADVSRDRTPGSSP